jgi:hypothetical protein
VARAEARVDHALIRHGEEDPGLRDAQIADDHGAVVQLVHRLRDEDADQELAADGGVEGVALVRPDELVEVRVLLEGDDGARSVPREIRGGLDDLVDDLGLLCLGRAEPGLAADAHQRAPDVALEHDDDEQQRGMREQRAEHALQRGELHLLGEHVQHEDHRHAEADLQGAGPPDDEQGPVEQVVDEEDIERVLGEAKGVPLLQVQREAARHGPAPARPRALAGAVEPDGPAARHGRAGCPRRRLPRRRGSTRWSPRGAPPAGSSPPR